MWQCSFCSFSSSWSFNVARHEERKHKHVSAPIINVTEPKQIELAREQPPLQSQMPLQQPLQFVETQHLGNARTGEREEVYSDDDTLSEYSSHGKQHDFFDSDSESDTEPGEVLENVIEEIDEQFDNIIELRGKFRGSLGEIKDADMEKKKRILKKVAALIVKIFDECEGINPDEDLESDEEEDADESEEEETEEDEDVDEEEGVNLNDDNPFSFIEEIKLSIDERDNEILDNEIQKVIKKHMDEKQDDIDQDESSDESDNEGGVTERVFKQDEKKLRQCINGVECEGCEYFEHCSNDKVDTIYRWCKHILNNEEQFDQKNLHKVKVKWMPIRFHVRALADPKQSLDAKRKILQKASVGDGVLSGLATLGLPMMKTFFRMMRDRD
jgi:hypothetical protein